MSVGTIPIAHNSAGPKMDILVDKSCGYLCQSEEEYANAITEVLQMDQSRRMKIARAARE